MENPLVSVVIPAYNAEKYIERTLQSVLQQTYPFIEIWVIDDGSTDQTASIVKQLSESYTRLHYIYQRNAGVSAARNHGFQKAKGKYVAFLDADDLWLPENVSLKVEHLEKQKHVGLVHSDALLINEQDESLNETREGKEGNILEDLLSWNGTCIPAPSSILMRRDVVDEVGGFDHQLSTAADQDFFFRVAAVTQIGRVPRITWHYRIHDSNMHSNIAAMEKDTLYVYKKAERNKLFKSWWFKRQCFGKMYMILSGSWYHNGKNTSKAIKYGLKSIWCYPPNIKKLADKWMK